MAVDLTNCDREQIHIPGSIQPHGMLLAQDGRGRVVYASQNIEAYLGVKVDEALGANGGSLLGPTFSPVAFEALHDRPVALDRLLLNETPFDVFLHRNPQGYTVLELETALSDGPPGLADAMGAVHATIDKVKSANDVSTLMQLAVREIRRITRLDRVMAYRFDEDYNGSVIAEDCVAHLPSYLEQHFPASDIPAQARELYRRNRLRVIGDVDYRPVPILSVLDPHEEAPLDLSHSLLRSVSPIHIEYLQNMGVAATMTGTLLSGGRLWGMIACHHYTKRRLSHEVRTACEMICQVLSLQIQLLEEAELRRGLISAHRANQEILELLMRKDDVLGGVQANLIRFKEAFDCAGLALVHGMTGSCCGDTPEEGRILELVKWLRGKTGGYVYATSHLGSAYAGGAAIKERASGVLALALGDEQDSYLIWFRPEVIQSVTWAGDPTKPTAVANEDSARLTPRKSFAAWTQEVSGRSLPWRPWEVDAARLLRSSMLNVLFRLSRYRQEVEARTDAEAGLRRQADDLQAANRLLSSAKDALEQSNIELQQFAYIASHDLQTPLRGIAGFASLLQEEYRERLDEAGNDYIERIVGGTKRMQSLIDDVLAFSRVESEVRPFVAVDLNAVFDSVLVLLEGAIESSGGSATRDALPSVVGDPAQLSQLLQNLVLNGLKYNKDETPGVHVSATRSGNAWTVSVRDNGIGIAAEHHERVFEIFRRLHSQKEYAGTGIGLAVCRRIVFRHGGRIWLESAPGDGSAFYFTIPAAGDDLT